jgi:hypothetical protein
MTHYHAFGEQADGGSKAGPANGVCRCEAHIAPPLKATRQRPECDLECYMCERARVLIVRLGLKPPAMNP